MVITEDLFKLVHLGTRTPGATYGGVYWSTYVRCKRAVRIPMECLLALKSLTSWTYYCKKVKQIVKFLLFLGYCEVKIGECIFCDTRGIFPILCWSIIHVMQYFSQKLMRKVILYNYKQLTAWKLYLYVLTIEKHHITDTLDYLDKFCVFFILKIISHFNNVHVKPA